jgi:hypothetical protein
VLLLDALIGQLALVFLIDVKNMVGVVNAHIQIVRILLKAEVCVSGMGIKSQNAKLMDVMSRAL